MIAQAADLVSTVLDGWAYLPAITEMLSIAIAWGIANWIQVAGSITSVIGALLMALNNRWSNIAWPLWIVSSVALSAYALRLPEPAYAFFFQQIIFGAINILGLWRWWFPALRSKSSNLITGSSN